MSFYHATWGKPLKWVSLCVSLLCVGLAVWQGWFLSRLHGDFPFWLAILPLLLVAGCALFCIRGYTLTPDMLIIHRLMWQTRIPLAGLTSAVFQPDAMRGSIRIAGNGGLFSFSGWFWNRSLGRYSCYVTALYHTVVLRFPDRRIVVSPDTPEAFAQELSRRCASGDSAGEAGAPVPG